MKAYYILYTVDGSKNIFRIDNANHEREAFNKAERFLRKSGIPRTKTITIVETDSQPEPLASKI